MYRNSTVGVVLPAYNEEGFVGDVLRDIPEYVDRIYAVNDCSTDGTWAEIVETPRESETDDHGRGPPLRLWDQKSLDQEDFVADAPVSPAVVQLFRDRVAEYRRSGDVVAIDHVKNFGAGGSVKTGYLAALIDGVDVVVTIDADGQMDPTIMDRLIDPVVDGTAEYAKGTRLLGREHRREMPWIRRLGNTSLTFMTKVASGYWDVTDSQNGYTAITRSALLRLGVEDLFEYYAYCNSVLVRLNVHDTPIADVEVPTTYGDETSDIEYLPFVRKVTPMLCRNFLWRLWRKHAAGGPNSVALLYAFGGVALILGTAATLALGTRASRTGRKRYSVAAAIAGALSIALAFALERSTSSDLVEIVHAETGDRHADRAPVAAPSD